jgi:hypothetical protein
MIDHDELARRSLDEPVDRDARAALRVWADALEAAGDPRGPLIAMEHALRDQPARRHALRQAMNEHVAANAPYLLGEIAAHLRAPRALSFDWRSGLLYGAFLDTRHLANRVELGPARLVEMLLGAPAAATLRRLHVRVRVGSQVEPVVQVLRRANPVRPLEEILVLAGVRPGQLVSPDRGSPSAAALAVRYPRLRLLADGDQLCALPLLATQASASGAALAHALAAADPGTADGRVALGRALATVTAQGLASGARQRSRADDGPRDVRPEPEARLHALHRLTELGDRGFVFVETLMLLLAPGIVTPQAPIVACLSALGDHARIALPLLATITGRAEHYDRETRRAAGVAIAHLRG